jgi:hypothetical protein
MKPPLTLLVPQSQGCEAADRLIFSRTTQVQAEKGNFKGKLKVILDNRLTGRYLKSLTFTTAETDIDGASSSLTAGLLMMSFPSTVEDGKQWTTARGQSVSSCRGVVCRPDIIKRNRYE